MKQTIFFLLFLITSLQAETYDVVVIGATSGGVTAAVQVAREGKTVVLLEPGKHVGGMTAGGLGWIDIKGTGSTGGLALEFMERVIKHYAAEGINTGQFGNSGWVGRSICWCPIRPTSGPGPSSG